MTTLKKQGNRRVQVKVLLATYNGIKWLPEQIFSILCQQDVEVELVISDDLSDDGTWEWLKALAANDARIHLLPPKGKFGGAAKNFYRLLTDADISGAEYIALADQDDIWNLDKLSRHVGIIKREGCQAVSSNVQAFWSDTRTRLIVKSTAQRDFDFLFESPGPGCSFLMTKLLIERMRVILTCDVLRPTEVLLHDWLIYAVCRAQGLSWYIDAVPSLLYRQHASNEFGANSGWRAKLSRTRKISGGWYREEILKITRICAYVSHEDRFERIAKFIELNGTFSNRIKLLPIVWQGRRRFMHRAALGVAVLLGLL